jgi:hypothetical protein
MAVVLCNRVLRTEKDPRRSTHRWKDGLRRRRVLYVGSLVAMGLNVGAGAE